MRRVIKNKKKMKNAMYIVFGVFALALFGVTMWNPSYAEEGLIIDDALDAVIGQMTTGSGGFEKVEEQKVIQPVEEDEGGEITEPADPAEPEVIPVEEIEEGENEDSQDLDDEDDNDDHEESLSGEEADNGENVENEDGDKKGKTEETEKPSETEEGDSQSGVEISETSSDEEIYGVDGGNLDKFVRNSIGVASADNKLIVHDTTGGTITVYTGDFSYGISFQDKNLGASTPGTGTESYGKYYKWGKNTEYDGRPDYSYVSNHDARGGGDDNQTENDRIVQGYDTKEHKATNLTGRQGPCPEGYHVPSAGEWYELMKLRCNANSGICTSAVEKQYSNAEQQRAHYLYGNGIGTAFSDDLLLPLAGYHFYYQNTERSAGEMVEYWASSLLRETDEYSSKVLYLSRNDVQPGASGSRQYGYSVRCFKNSHIEIPKKILNLSFMPLTGSTHEIGTGEVTENMTGSVPVAVTTAMSNVVNTGYTFSGSWSLSGETTAFDFENRQVSGDWADTSGNVYFIAQWTPITYTISFSGNAADATGTAPATINAEYDSGDIAPDNSFTLTGYTFTGWNTESNGSGTGYTTGAELKNLTTTSGDDVMLYAQWEVNVHKLNFVVDGTTIQSGDVAYAAAISAPAEPKKDCNSFAGWTSSVEGLTTTGTMPDSDVTFTANWNYVCSRSSGGGGTKAKTNTRELAIIDVEPEQEEHNSADEKPELKQEDEQEIEQVVEIDGGTQKTVKIKDTEIVATVRNTTYSSSAKFTREENDAYSFAKSNGLTTTQSIETAKMNTSLKRIEMAKMLSNFAINVLRIQPDTEKGVIKFSDVSKELDKQYDNAVTKAYQLGIMGQNVKNDKFRPNDEVTRAEFASALSRLLFKTPEGKYKGTSKYYVPHIAKLYNEGIINKVDEKIKEKRGYVMIMLKRTVE